MAKRIKSRIEMASLLQERMTKTYSTLLDKQELEPDTTLVKSYVKEAHLSENEENDKVFGFAKSLFSDEVAKKRLGLHLRRSEEDYFFIVESRIKQEPVTIYLDATNTRFWVLHSMNSSNALDYLFDTIVGMTPLLDHTWMPIHLLEEISKFGDLRGLSLDYDRRKVPDVDFETNEGSVEFLKMQLWGNKASDVLRILRQKDAFPHESTLSKVKIKRWAAENDKSEFSIDDIKYDGKITARGTSFSVHNEILQEIHSQYRKLIAKVEAEFSLEWNKKNGQYALSGEPVNFVLKRPIANLKSFCEHLFDTSPPFRLWGTPRFLNENYVLVNAVDLHVGTRMNFEITSNFIRLYLPAGGCGNSVIRVFTNLQHYYDSLIEAENGNERSVFQQL